MNNLIIFIGIMAVILAGLFTFVRVKVGSWQGVKDYVKKIENKTIWQATAGLILAMIIAAFFVAMIGKAAKADEVEWFYKGSVFVGIDYNKGGSVFCQSEGVNDELNSNMGAKIGAWKWGNHTIGIKYTHHSCALNPDVHTYDTPGFEYEWAIW